MGQGGRVEGVVDAGWIISVAWKKSLASHLERVQQQESRKTRNIRLETNERVETTSTTKKGKWIEPFFLPSTKQIRMNYSVDSAGCSQNNPS
mmetsp:Transcript_28909/g.60459  ORF Transcript_28909/g.60459 Transcript_28909/m.60459 type:complete len:92 (+) Transcript_28909:637-912(+)